MVKTDGNTLYALANGKLNAVDVSSAKPRVLDTLALDPGQSHELLLHGDRLLVLSMPVANKRPGTIRNPPPIPKNPESAPSPDPEPDKLWDVTHVEPHACVAVAATAFGALGRRLQS